MMRRKKPKKSELWLFVLDVIYMLNLGFWTLKVEVTKWEGNAR